MNIEFPPRTIELKLNLNEREAEALTKLCTELEMTTGGVLRHALRFYQNAHVRMNDGETMHFSGDAARRAAFGPPLTKQAGTEMGPWDVRAHEDEVYVDSDDFTHDVCLIVRGDLGTIEQKKAYAAKIVEILEAHGPFKFADYDEKTD